MNSRPVHAKLVSVGDLCPQGVAPMTIEGSDGVRHVILLDDAQCRYFESRLKAINEKTNEAGN